MPGGDRCGWTHGRSSLVRTLNPIPPAPGAAVSPCRPSPAAWPASGPRAVPQRDGAGRRGRTRASIARQQSTSLHALRVRPTRAWCRIARNGRGADPADSVTTVMVSRWRDEFCVMRARQATKRPGPVLAASLEPTHRLSTEGDGHALGVPQEKSSEAARARTRRIRVGGTDRHRASRGQRGGGGSGPDSVGGLPAGTIHHVWLIILENKSYDETFTGLNSNSYLWQTLPSEGVLLKNYYGTGHTSQDNYIALASGQAPRRTPRTTAATPTHRSVPTRPSSPPARSAPTAQLELRAGRSSSGSGRTPDPRATTTNEPPHHPHQRVHLPDRHPDALRPVQRRRRELEGLRPGPGGPSPSARPRSCPTACRAVRTAACGAPGTVEQQPGLQPDPHERHLHLPRRRERSPRRPWSRARARPTTPAVLGPVRGQALPLPVVRLPDRRRSRGPDGHAAHRAPGPAGGGTNCDANHIANLDDPNHGLVADLNNNTVPQFSWITPDNCSDAHDTTCKGNNLSGAFGTYTSGPHAGQVNLNDPIYDPPGCRPTTPRPPRRGTSPVASTPPTCSWRTTSRSLSSRRPTPTAA